MLTTFEFDDKYQADEDGFTFDLSAWLGTEGDAIATADATVTSPATIAGIVRAGSDVCVWISGGSPGATHTIDLHVVTTGVGGARGRDCHVRGSFGVVA